MASNFGAIDLSRNIQSRVRLLGRRGVTVKKLPPSPKLDEDTLMLLGDLIALGKKGLQGLRMAVDLDQLQRDFFCIEARRDYTHWHRLNALSRVVFDSASVEVESIPRDRIAELLRLQQKVLVLNAGGTINMEGSVGRRAGSGFERLLDRTRELIGEPRKVFPHSPDSSNIASPEWNILSRVIRNALAEKAEARSLLRLNGVPVDRGGGITITHGTDTLHESTLVVALEQARWKAESEAGVDFQLPITFTGSWLPPDQVGTDAYDNFFRAVHLANDRAVPPLVYLMLGDCVHIGARVRKVSTSPTADGQYFRSLNPAGQITEVDGTLVRQFSPKFVPWADLAQSRPFPSDLRSSADQVNFGYVEHLAFDQQTATSVLESAFERLLKARAQGKAVGIVIQGNFSNHSGFGEVRSIIRRFADNQIPVLVGSKAVKDKLGDEVVLLPKSVNYFSARTKLSWLLGLGIDYEKGMRYIIKDVAGEIPTIDQLPDFIKYETYAPNSPQAGRAVVIAFPDMIPEVVGDAVDSLLAQAGEKRLVIVGFGDGNLPTGNDSIFDITLAHLRRQHPEINGVTERIAARAKNKRLTLFELSDELARTLSDQSELMVKLAKQYQISGDEFVKTLTQTLLRERKGKATSDIEYLINRIAEVDPAAADKLRAADIENIDGFKAALQKNILSDDLTNLFRFCPSLLAQNLIREALIVYHPILEEIGRATDPESGNITVEMRTNAPQAEANILSYELGNMLLALGAGDKIHRGWKPAFVKK